jgi:hypothetical protein
MRYNHLIVGGRQQSAENVSKLQKTCAVDNREKRKLHHQLSRERVTLTYCGTTYFDETSSSTERVFVSRNSG